MSAPPNMVAAQIFFFLQRISNGLVYAYEAPDGLTVPIFSSMDLANEFLQRTRVRGHSVAMISPTQMGGFSEACRQSGAKFLQLDPQPVVIKNAKAKNIGGESQ